jgi:hypothetical protein
MSELAVKLLKDLHARSEPTVERKQSITTPASRIANYPFTNASLLTEFHEYLKLAASRDAIQIEWKPHYVNHELLRVRLVDPVKLSEFLGIERLQDKIASTIERMDKPSWLPPFITTIFERWQRGKSSYRMKPADTLTLTTVIQAVNGIEALGDQEVMDYRQFGARYLDGSKRLKEIMGPLCALYRERLALLDLADKDLLSTLNLVSLSHPVFITGPVVAGNGQHAIDLDVSPYVGIPYSLLEKIRITQAPDYVLTIENLSSFNEYTRNIRDKAVIIYTAGYPTRHWQAFYQRLVHALPGIPVFHWGDADPHGFQILRTLQRCVPQTSVQQHLMDQATGAAYSKPDIRLLEKLIPTNPTIDALLRNLITNRKWKYEQELIPAQPPSLDSQQGL